MTIKIPKSLAAAADLYGITRDKRLALQKEVDAIEADEKALKDHLINSIPKSDATGIAGKVWRVGVTGKDVPVVKNWTLFYEYISKTRTKGGFALLSKAVNAKSVAEIWAAGKKVPGVESFHTTSLSLSKL
jgi:hypothetical protein